jgi:hypothetical protein
MIVVDLEEYLTMLKILKEASGGNNEDWL